MRKQCWDPGLCDEKGRRGWMGPLRVRLEGGLRCPSVRRESIAIISFDHSGPSWCLTRSREVRGLLCVRHEGINQMGAVKLKRKVFGCELEE